MKKSNKYVIGFLCGVLCTLIVLAMVIFFINRQAILEKGWNNRNVTVENGYYDEQGKWHSETYYIEQEIIRR